MSNLKVNTDGVISTADNIKNINKQIRDDFSGVESAISQLDKSWDGLAATNSINKFKEIKAQFYDNRYNVVDNYVAFLHKMVGDAYVQVEDINKSLASSFK